MNTVHRVFKKKKVVQKNNIFVCVCFNIWNAYLALPMKTLTLCIKIFFFSI